MSSTTLRTTAVPTGPPSLTAFPPLTTTFTPPSWCDDPLSNTWNTQTFDISTIVLQRYNPSCYPRHTHESMLLVTWNEPNWSLTLLPTFSPGVCPSGRVALGATSTDNQSPTTAYCCRSNYQLESSGSTTWCVTSTIEDEIVEVQTTRADVIQVGPSMSTSLAPYTTKAVLQGDTHFYEPAVPIMWASSDLDQLHAVATQTSTTTASAVAPPPSSSQNSGLSVGAKAGIGVGAVVGGLSLIALIVFGIWYCRKKRNTARDQKTPSPFTEIEQPYSDRDQKLGHNDSGDAVFEMHVSAPLSELDASNDFRLPK